MTMKRQATYNSVLDLLVRYMINGSELVKIAKYLPKKYLNEKDKWGKTFEWAINRAYGNLYTTQGVNYWRDTYANVHQDPDGSWDQVGKSNDKYKISGQEFLEKMGIRVPADVQRVTIDEIKDELQKVRLNNGVEMKELKVYGSSSLSFKLSAYPWYLRTFNIRLTDSALEFEAEPRRVWSNDIAKQFGLNEPVQPDDYLYIPSIKEKSGWKHPSKKGLKKLVARLIQETEAEETAKLISTKLKQLVFKQDRWLDAIVKRYKTVFGSEGTPYGQNTSSKNLRGWFMYEYKSGGKRLFYVGLGFSGMRIRNGQLTATGFVNVFPVDKEGVYSTKKVFDKHYKFSKMSEITQAFKEMKPAVKQAIAFAQQWGDELSDPTAEILDNFAYDMKQNGWHRLNRTDFELRTGLGYEHGEPPEDEYEADSWYERKTDEFRDEAKEYWDEVDRLAKKYGIQYEGDDNEQYGSFDVTVTQVGRKKVSSKMTVADRVASSFIRRATAIRSQKVMRDILGS